MGRSGWSVLLLLVAGCPTSPTPRCATDRDCPAPLHECYRGLCVPVEGAGTDGGAADTRSPCPLGRTLCDGSCVDTSTSRDHCGGCDRDCHGGDAMCRFGFCMEDD
jgi:hypothetical protein